MCSSLGTTPRVGGRGREKLGRTSIFRNRSARSRSSGQPVRLRPFSPTRNWSLSFPSRARRFPNPLPWSRPFLLLIFPVELGPGKCKTNRFRRLGREFPHPWIKPILRPLPRSKPSPRRPHRCRRHKDYPVQGRSRPLHFRREHHRYLPRLLRRHRRRVVLPKALHPSSFPTGRPFPPEFQSVAMPPSCHRPPHRFCYHRRGRQFLWRMRRRVRRWWSPTRQSPRQPRQAQAQGLTLLRINWL
jgi:hypothetical protein